MSKMNLIIGAGILIATMAFVWVIGEFYARACLGFKPIVWPGTYIAGIGSVFLPNHRIVYTNFSDFSTQGFTNSLGFVDREPMPVDENRKEIRIAFIGDSFVEAVQVDVNQKSHIVLENILNKKYKSKPCRTYAFGYSGTGQANQLPYYDFYAKKFKPHVVVLVIVGNDFANNSPVLESLRNGWSPSCQPRMTVQVDNNSSYTFMEPQLNFKDHLLPHYR